MVVAAVAKMGSGDPSTANAKATRELGSRDTATPAVVAAATTTATSLSLSLPPTPSLSLSPSLPLTINLSI